MAAWEKQIPSGDDRQERQGQRQQRVLRFVQDDKGRRADGLPEVEAVELVSGNAFAALGIEPLAGRLLQASDDAGPGAGPVAVISDGYWARRFGRSPAAVGKLIALNGVPVTIVGVSARRFAGPCWRDWGRRGGRRGSILRGRCDASDASLPSRPAAYPFCTV